MILALVFAASLTAVPLSTSPPPTPVLVLDDADYVFPRVSPDGRHLVVARAAERPDGSETTDVVLVELASGATRELISRKEAEANEAYETFVIGLRWLDGRRVEISLSDGDVGGKDIVADALTGTILSTKYSDDGDELVPSDFAAVVVDARYYRRYFSREELERSLGASSARLDGRGILVQRTARDTPKQPVFYIEPVKRRITLIAMVPAAMRLGDAVQAGRRITFLTTSEELISVDSYDGRATATVAKWAVATENQCPRLETFADRLFVFVRPCTRSEPSQGTLWEVTRAKAVPYAIDEHLDEFSASADGSRIALGVWRNGKRIVKVFDGSVLRLPNPR